MTTLTATDIQDLVNGTLKELGRQKIQQIAQSAVDYPTVNVMLKKERMTTSDGIGIQRNLMTKLPDVARFVGMYGTDQTNIEDLTTQLNVPWRHANTNWSFEAHEVTMNRGKSLIFNVIEPRRVGAKLDWVEMMESALWDAPSRTDKLRPYGIPYWIVKNNTVGFNGGYASDHTDVGGVDVTLHPTFKNYTGQYAAISKTDLIQKMRTAATKCKFTAPAVVSMADYRKGMDKYRVYCNEASLRAFENVGESQNENLGRDIASMDGTITFRKFPIIYTPVLDADTTDPIYGIDHSTLFVHVLEGWEMKESEVIMHPTNHNIFSVHVDTTLNTVCVDRRRNWVFNK